MTMDDTALATALRELAETVPDDPARLSHVHHLARRRHRRQRVIGAGALAATIAAAGFGADALASGGGTPSTGIHPASGGSAAPAPAPVSGGTAAALPACPAAPPPQPANKPAPPPSIGQQFTGGGTVSVPGTASSVSIQVDGGPMAGSDLTLTISPASQISLDGNPATGAQVPKGTRAKFSATRTGTDTYILDDLHAGTAGATAGPKQGAPGVVAPPAVGENFKVAGSVTAVTATTMTVDVQGGSLPPGRITFTLECSPAGPLVGKMVSVAGTRTGTSTYDASMVVLAGS